MLGRQWVRWYVIVIKRYREYIRYGSGFEFLRMTRGLLSPIRKHSLACPLMHDIARRISLGRYQSSDDGARFAKCVRNKLETVAIHSYLGERWSGLDGAESLFHIVRIKRAIVALTLPDRTGH